MKTIWKVQLEPKEMQTFDLPAEAKFLSAQAQHNSVSVWFLCDSAELDEEKEANRKRKEFTFYSFATGHLDDNYGLDKAQFLGTIQFNHGRAIFHIFVK